MNHAKTVKYMLVVSVITLLTAGCSGKGTGDTVPTPPRALVDKSFHPPAAVPAPGTRPSNPR